MEGKVGMKVFISYSHVDARIAQEIAKALNHLGVAHFHDVKDINWGDKILEKVHGGLREASHLILLISPGSVKSQWVAFEVGYALGLNVCILPFLTHPSLEVPDFLRGIKHIASLDEILDYFSKQISYDISAKAVDLSGKWESNISLVELRQTNMDFEGRYQYHRPYPRHGSIQGHIVGNIALFRWTEILREEALTGIGFWKIENENNANGYWFYDGEVPTFDEIMRDPALIIMANRMTERQWNLTRQA